jgi:5'-3' exonuclease
LTLFQRLARLYTLGVKAIFVFDGPDKPLMKRNHQTYQGLAASDSEIILRRLIELFGFQSWNAAGEAEAECANLLNLGIVDLIVTDDVDALMFGAKKMITNWQQEYISYFDMKTIKEQLELDQDGLVLIGLLAGNDYMPSGSKNIGIHTAVGLAKAGIAPKVIYAKTTREKEDARDTVISELETNASGKLDQKRPSAAKMLPEDFPEQRIVKLLRYPKCKAISTTVPEEVVSLNKFDDPNLTELAAYVQSLFHMPIPEIRERLVSLLFPGYALQCVKSEMRSGVQRSTSHIERIPNNQVSVSNKIKSDITSYFSVTKNVSLPKSPAKATTPSDTLSASVLCINRERQPMDAKTCHVKEYQVQINPSCMLQFLELISKRLCYYAPISPFNVQDALCSPSNPSPSVPQQSECPDVLKTPVRKSGSFSSPDCVELSDDEEPHTWKYKKIDRSEPCNTPRSISIASSMRAGEENPKLKEIRNWTKVNRQWMDSVMIKRAYPDVVREYEDKQSTEVAKKKHARSKTVKRKAPSKVEPGQKTITEMAFGIQTSDGTIEIKEDRSVNASVVRNEDIENPFLVQDKSNPDGQSPLDSLVIPRRRKPYTPKSKSNKSRSGIFLHTQESNLIDSDSDSESILSVIAQQNKSITKAS